MAARILSIAVAREAIEESLGGPWKRGIPAASGVIDCPVCKAKKSLRCQRSHSRRVQDRGLCSVDGVIFKEEI